jgi:hypothetical protein
MVILGRDLTTGRVFREISQLVQKHGAIAGILWQDRAASLSIHSPLRLDAKYTLQLNTIIKEPADKSPENETCTTCLEDRRFTSWTNLRKEFVLKTKWSEEVTSFH